MDTNQRESLIQLSRRSFLRILYWLCPQLRSPPPKSEQNWPGFRGIGAQGIADGYPTRVAWNADAAAGKLSGISMAH